MCPFRLRRHLAVGTQKEPEATMDTPATVPTRRHGKARWVHRVQKIPVGIFGSLCIPPPLMRISRLWD